MDSVGYIGFSNEKVVDEWRTEMKILSLKHLNKIRVNYKVSIDTSIKP